MKTKTPELASLPPSLLKTDAILHLVRLERLRQNALVESGQLPFNCSDPMPTIGDSHAMLGISGVIDLTQQGVANAIKLAVLTEEVGEVAKEVYTSAVFDSDEDTIAKLRTELVQVAAVAVAWAESL